MPERKYQSGSASYRYSINGQERESDLNENITSALYWEYDSRIGRRWNLDPKPQITISDFSVNSNNPIVNSDPLGDEKIVTTGGADKHNKNRMNFVNASAARLKQYRKELNDKKSDEKLTWVIFDLDYTKEEKARIQEIANSNGVGEPIYITSTEELINYVNYKDTKGGYAGPIPFKGQIERLSDKITNMSIFSHGVSSAIAFGYENTGYTWVYSDKTVLSMNNASEIKPEAFTNNSEVNLFSCNSANARSDNGRRDFKTKQELVNSAFVKGNLVKQLSSITKGIVTGHIGQTSYVPAASGKLPTSATTGGDNSPMVQNKEIPTINVKCKDGKCQDNN